MGEGNLPEKKRICFVKSKGHCKKCPSSRVWVIKGKKNLKGRERSRFKKNNIATFFGHHKEIGGRAARRKGRT